MKVQPFLFVKCVGDHVDGEHRPGCGTLYGISRIRVGEAWGPAGAYDSDDDLVYVATVNPDHAPDQYLSDELPTVGETFSLEQCWNCGLTEFEVVDAADLP